jgi:acyl carrier protein
MAPWSRQFEDVLRACMKAPSDTRIEPDTRLRDLGIDSIEIVELIMVLEDEFNVEISDDLLTPATFETAGTIWGLLCAIVPPSVDADARGQH